MTVTLNMSVELGGKKEAEGEHKSASVCAATEAAARVCAHAASQCTRLRPTGFRRPRVGLGGVRERAAQKRRAELGNSRKR